MYFLASERALRWGCRGRRKLSAGEEGKGQAVLTLANGASLWPRAIFKPKDLKKESAGKKKDTDRDRTERVGEKMTPDENRHGLSR